MRALLAIRDFRLLFIGQAMSNWGNSLTNLALLILAQRLTGSVAAVAGTAIAIALPQLLIGLVAGVYVDRWNRRTVMIVSDVVRGILVLGFVLVGTADRIWLLYLIAFLQAAAGTFFNPAKGALIPAIVGRERLLGANSTMDTARVVVGLLGTATAGVWAGLSESLWPIFVLDAATFLVSALFEAGIRTDARPTRPSGMSPPSVVSEMLVGLRTATSSPTLVGVLVSVAVLMFGLGAVNVLIVPFVVDDLAVSETWFGALEGAQVVSMILGGSLVAALAARLRPTRIITTSLAGIGMVIASVALVQEAWHLVVVLFAVGWFVTPLQASVSTLVQSEVADELRGRIGSAMGTVIEGANVASMALAGVAAALIGIRGVFVLSGAVAVVASAVSVALFRTRPPVEDVTFAAAN